MIEATKADIGKRVRYVAGWQVETGVIKDVRDTSQGKLAFVCFDGTERPIATRPRDLEWEE